MRLMSCTQRWTNGRGLRVTKTLSEFKNASENNSTILSAPKYDSSLREGVDDFEEIDDNITFGSPREKEIQIFVSQFMKELIL